MGYYTEYSLYADTEDIQEIKDKLQEVFGDTYINEGCTFTAKWYNHEQHLESLSDLFPDVEFRLEAEGEEPDDLWIKYFKNGKVQVLRAKVEVTYPEYNEANYK